jgi:hypothetical protein
LPDLRLENPEILINAAGIPLHAGIAFGAGMAIMLWLWANRDLGKCLLAMALILMGWLAAVNTANDVMTAVVSSELLARSGRESEPGGRGMDSGRTGRRRDRPVSRPLAPAFPPRPSGASEPGA